MKKHLIPLLIIVLLGLSGLLLTLGAWMLFELGDGIDHMAGTALWLASMMPCIYGPAVALLIPLHRRKMEVPRGYAWLGVISFAAVVIGVVTTTVGYYAIFLEEIDSWMLLFWSAWGLLLPFFVSSVADLKEPVPEKTPEELRRIRKGRLIALFVCLGVALVTGGGLYLHKKSQPHLLSVSRERSMYERLQRRIAADEPWGTVDQATYISAKGDGSDREERELTGEERAAMALLCRELIRPRTDREEWHHGTVVPRKRMQYLWVDYQAAADVVVEGETYQVINCVLKEYYDASELQLEYTQGEMRYAVILRWEEDE